MLNREETLTNISEALAEVDNWAQIAFDLMRETREKLFAEIDRETEGNVRPSIVSAEARRYRAATALHKAAYRVQVEVEGSKTVTGLMQTVTAGMYLAEAVEEWHTALGAWQRLYGMF